MDDERITATIDRYRNAFEAANGKPAPTIHNWGNGWFRMERDGQLHRLGEFDAWSDRLELRVKERNSSTA